MKRTVRDEGVPRALPLVEEAVHVLRRAPAAFFASYYAGVIPFALVFLFFCGEATRSARAEQVLFPLAVILGLLFVWMKAGQALAFSYLLAYRRAEEAPRWTPAKLGQLVLRQATLQPWKLPFYALAGYALLSALGRQEIGALALALPFASAVVLIVALVSSPLTVLSVTEGVRFQHEDRSSLELLREAGAVSWRHTLSLYVVMAVAGMIVFVNWGALMVAFPVLARDLFGFQSLLTDNNELLRSPLLRGTGLILTYLTLDPLLKTSLMLRAYYAQSRYSGDDLRWALRRIVRAGSIGVLLLIALAAAPAPAAASTSAAESGDFDEAAEETLAEREYAWRFPREEYREAGETAPWVEKIRDRWERFEAWLRGLFESDKEAAERDRGWQEGERDTPNVSLLDWAGRIFMVVTAIVLLFFIVRALLHYRREQTDASAVAAEEDTATPDLASEDVTAADLPLNKWIALAREKRASGEYRLALRAYFLAMLALLADRNLIRLARFKSNLDYQRELDRQSHSLPEIFATYQHSVARFESAWFGDRAVSESDLDAFEEAVHRVGGLA